MSKSSDNPNEFREQGNQEFKQGHFQKAIEHYSVALKLLNELSLSDTIKTDLTKCYSNRAQCYINLEQYEDAIEDTTRGTDIRHRCREDFVSFVQHWNIHLRIRNLCIVERMHSND